MGYNFDLSKVLIGADPEFFVSKPTFGPISAHTFGCGTKANPLKTLCGSVQVDGLALEVNVTPANTAMDFLRNVRGVVTDLTDIVSTVDPKAFLVCEPTAEFGRTYLEMLPPEAKELGCTPDMNAYTMLPNPKPDDEVSFRTAAGHIHIGWTEDADVESVEHIVLCSEITKQLDFILGVRSLDFDHDNKRRELYGKAGAFRPKPYGLEYRVLSNKWLGQDRTVLMMFNRTMRALRQMNDGMLFDEHYPCVAQEIIDENKVNWRREYAGLSGELL